MEYAFWAVRPGMRGILSLLQTRLNAQISVFCLTLDDGTLLLIKVLSVFLRFYRCGLFPKPKNFSCFFCSSEDILVPQFQICRFGTFDCGKQNPPVLRFSNL